MVYMQLPDLPAVGPAEGAVMSDLALRSHRSPDSNRTTTITTAHASMQETSASKRPVFIRLNLAPSSSALNSSPSSNGDATFVVEQQRSSLPLRA